MQPNIQSWPTPETFIHTGMPAGNVPVGGIVMWSGTIATIPAGWHLCDGTNGTPDLRNRFIVCANVDTTGHATSTINGAAAQSGGSISHQHTLNATFNEIALDLQAVNLGGTGTTHNYYDENTASNIGPQPTDAGGVAQPFFALAYIQKL